MGRTILLVDDHEVVRRGLRYLIESDPDLEVVAEARDGREALGIIDNTSVDLALLDYELPDVDGIELCREIKSRRGTINCLMLTARDDDDALTKAILAGASGYLLKSLDSDRLIESIRAAARGQSLIGPADVARIVDHQRNRRGAVAELTERENEILALIARGDSNKEIAQHMYLAEKTVRNYVSNILAKLGLRSRTDAAVYVLRQRSDD